MVLVKGTVYFLYYHFSIVEYLYQLVIYLAMHQLFEYAYIHVRVYLYPSISIYVM